MYKFLPVILGIALLTVAALPQAEAMPVPFPLLLKPPCPEVSVEEINSKLSLLAKEKSSILTGIQKMKEKLSRAEQAVKEGRKPDFKGLKPKGNVGAERSEDYLKDHPYIQNLFDEHEAQYQPYNWLDSLDAVYMMLRYGARGFILNEIERSEHYIQDLDDEKERLNGCLNLHEAKRNNDQPDCPSGAYLVACDPGMGGEPPFISDAMQPGQGFQQGAPWGSDNQPPTEPTEPGRPQGPYGTGPPTGPTEPGQPPPGGYPPYQCGYPGYPPCPPGYSPPYDPTKPPWWEGLIPPSKAGMPPKPTPPMGPAPSCGPATSCICAGGGIGHIPCDKSKGSCHCGAG
jgi:hypothetical protein